MAAKQGFLNYYSDSNAIGIKVSGRYRRSVCISGVVVERGSTVHYTEELVSLYPYNHRGIQNENFCTLIISSGALHSYQRAHT